MSAVDPLNAMFAMLGGVTLGLTGLAAGPVITPLFLLLYLGFKASGG